MLSRGTSIILLLTYIGYLIFQLRTHSQLFEADVAEGEEEEVPDMDPISSGIWLLIITVITAFAADVLVGSIDETAQQWKIPKRFIGLILLPLVGNAAEHVTSVWMACKGVSAIPTSPHIAFTTYCLLHYFAYVNRKWSLRSAVSALNAF
jgi:Ca2+:H+ antiporter